MMGLSSTDDRLAQGDLQVRDLGDELVIYDAAGDRMHVLNETAREIFLLCDGHRSVAEITDTICERFEVDRDVAGGDVLRTIEDLLQRRVLRRG